MRIHTSLLVLSLLTLSACSLPGFLSGGGSSSSSSSVSSFPETQNVLYQGVLEKIGASIYMEGTHKLELEDGRFLLLESVIDLNAYEGKKVEVLGSVRPTVEAGGQIMRVERITSMEVSSSSESSSEMSESASSLSSESSSSEVASAVSSVQSSVAVSSSKVSSVVSSVISSSSKSSVATVSSVPYQASDDLTEKATIMAKADMSMSKWTQNYCAKSAKICVLIHKNWFYNAFNSSPNPKSLWHLEIGPSEINNLGEGPLVLDIEAGASTSDGVVRTEGDSVVGEKNYAPDRHIVVRAPSNLSAAVEILLKNVTAQQ